MSEPSTASALPRPIAVLVNAHSRRGRAQLRTALAALREANIPFGDVHILHDKRATEHLLQREIASGARTVIIGGGDGTLSACADHLAHTDVAMAILPLGTGNTFVRSLGIPINLAAAVQVIAHGRIAAVDVGRVNRQIFLNSVSLGLSAEIAGALNKRMKRRLGLLAWPIVGAKVLYRHRPLILKVVSHESTFPVRTHQIVIANGRYVAGPIAAAPDASVHDHQLDVFVLGGARHGSLARAALQWLLGHHTTSPLSRHFTTRALRVESVRHPLPANVDGEINEQTPLDVELLPRALRVVVPSDFAAGKV